MSKRGRKPKNKILNNINPVNKENPIITNLPINIDNDDNIFIKHTDSKDIQITKLKHFYKNEQKSSKWPFYL